MKHAYYVLVSFRAASSLAAHEILGELRAFIECVGSLSPRLRLDQWLLAGNTVTEAEMYTVFDNGQPTVSAIAVSEALLKGASDPRSIKIWNGQEESQGASAMYIGRPNPNISLLTFTAGPDAFTDDWKAISNAISKAAVLWKSAYITLHSNGYWPHQTFKDRPGVGWMLYLDKVITLRQVPEARALVPVMDGKQQIGTIIVSEIDGPFSDANPEHVRVANQIEVRLADLDLLPRL